MPLQYDFRLSAAKDNSIAHAAAASAIELRAKPTEIAAPKPEPVHRHSTAIYRHWVAKHNRIRRDEALQTWPWRSNSIAICNHCLANHNRTAPMQAACLDGQTQWHSPLTHLIDLLQNQLWSVGCVRGRPRAKPHPSHKRGSQQCRQKTLYARKHKGWCSSYSHLDEAFSLRSASTSLQINMELMWWCGDVMKMSLWLIFFSATFSVEWSWDF